jgi:hypothetical protein
MYKTLSALGVVLTLVFTGLYKLEVINPAPRSNVVLAEKPDGQIGGQVAVVVPDDLTDDQHQILSVAYKIAKQDGHKNPELVQSMLLQETHAGGLTKFKVAGNKGDEYYGIAQIKLGAAKDILALYPDLWKRYEFHTRTDDEVKANLILNPKFNIEIASKYLKLLQERYGFRGRELLNAYNRGPSGVKAVNSATFHYAREAEQKLASWKQHGSL